MTFTVIFFGAEKSGKSSIFQSLTTPQYQFSEHYQPTIGLEWAFKNYSEDDSEDDFKLRCYDLGSNAAFHSITTGYHKCGNIGVYCVDLTEPLDKEKIKADIASFKEKAPKKASLIIVGTKSDVDSANIKEFEELDYKELGCINSFIVSSKSETGLKKLFAKLHELSKKHFTHPIDIALQNLPKSSLLYNEVSNLKNKMVALPSESIEFIGTKVQELITNLQGVGSVYFKEQAINNFKNDCSSHLAGESPLLKAAAKAVKVVAITAFVTFLAALVGFGIGFGMGVWTGPGAFISGILASGSAALAVVLSSAIAGGVTGSLSAYGFFKASPTEEATDEIAHTARNMLLADNKGHYNNVTSSESYYDATSSDPFASSSFFPWSPLSMSWPLHWGR
ncbi:MAG: ADP-ribosylation factor-like protein [Legionella sp.]|nr:ADP-ribosylation factor-like protein [Legionella sp.]